MGGTSVKVWKKENSAKRGKTSASWKKTTQTSSVNKTVTKWTRTKIPICKLQDSPETSRRCLFFFLRYLNHINGVGDSLEDLYLYILIFSNIFIFILFLVRSSRLE